MRNEVLFDHSDQRPGRQINLEMIRFSREGPHPSAVRPLR
jgi:hypothetical protein